MVINTKIFWGQFTKNQPHLFTFAAFLAGICLLIGVAVRIVAVQPLTHDPMVQAPFHDDGFYYLEIARNIATSGVFTFDGINRTNGFHPLWQLLLALLAHFSVQDFLFIRLVMYFSVALFLLTGILLFKLAKEYGGSSAGLAAVILWSLSPDLIMWQNQGMENTIYLPILVFALIQIDRFIRFPTNLREASTLGLTFGLLMWSRSDSVLFVGLALIGIVIYLWRASRSATINQVRALVVVVGIVFLFGVGYLLFNYYAAGSFMSVSGVVKLGDSSNSSWQLSQTIDALNVHLSMVGSLFSALGGLTWWGFNWRILPFRLFIVAWIAIVLVGWGIYLSKKTGRTVPGSDQDKRIGLTLLLVYTIIHTTILTTLLRDILRWTPWYIVPQVLTVLVVVPLVLFPERIVEGLLEKVMALASRYMEKAGFSRKNRLYDRAFYQLCGLCIFVLAILVPCIWAVFVPVKGWWQQIADAKTLEPRYELAVWLNQHISSDARVGMFDAGITGYFAHAHVVNLDGLVNSPEYVAVRRTGAYADYIVGNRIEYVINYYYPPLSMNWGYPTGSSEVCYKLLHVNKNPALWGADRVKNYFEVMALRYDGKCKESWKPGFPLRAVPPDEFSTNNLEISGG